MSGFVTVEAGGPLTTVQDLGRYGYQHLGMPVAGAMDQYACRVSNLIVGNQENAPVLEATLSGPSIVFHCSTVVCVAGGDMAPLINDCPIQLWRGYKVARGDRLKLGYAREGIRGYISVAGGFLCGEIMGSAATYIKAGIGGHEGRPLQAGDRIDIGSGGQEEVFQLPACYVPKYTKDIQIRAVLGPHEQVFAEEGIRSLLCEAFTVSGRSDRMGIFLEGPLIETKEKTSDIISAAIVMGSIQITTKGQPVILMADRQTAGGYGQIATVITPDLPKLAQARPGDNIRFCLISPAQARQEYIAYENKIRAVGKLKGERLAVKAASYYQYRVLDKSYHIIVEEGEA